MFVELVAVLLGPRGVLRADGDPPGPTGLHAGHRRGIVAAVVASPEADVHRASNGCAGAG
jgi:hypothetical protein